MQQRDTMEFVKESLETMEERNGRFEAIVSDSLKTFEQRYQEGQEGIQSEIASFSEKVSEFSEHAEDIHRTQNECLEQFSSNLEYELQIFTRNLNYAMGDSLDDLGTRTEEMMQELRSLGNEYRRFEAMSQAMVDKMRSISAEDFGLMKELFKDEGR